MGIRVVGARSPEHFVLSRNNREGEGSGSFVHSEYIIGLQWGSIVAAHKRPISHIFLVGFASARGGAEELSVE